MIAGSTAPIPSPDHVPDAEGVKNPPAPAIQDPPSPETAMPAGRKQPFVKVDEPKSVQFSARATEAQAATIRAALAANGVDIVGFALLAIKAFQGDILSSVKTK